MLNNDYEYVNFWLHQGLIQPPCLEIGAGLEGRSMKLLLESAGLEWVGADLQPGTDVSYVLDFCIKEEVKQTFGNKQFGSVFILNVLEHVFDPIRMLDNAFSVLKPGGACIITAPVTWELHSYPIDCWRINPDFYKEYTKRRGLDLIEDTFEYLGRGKVRDFKGLIGYQLPPPTSSKMQKLKSKIVHKLFNTYGRGMFFPSHLSLAVILKKGADCSPD